MKEWALQQAIYGVLSVDTGLAALGASVYDHVPQNAAFPYVVIGEDYATKADTDDTLDADHMITLHSWSRIEANADGH